MLGREHSDVLICEDVSSTSPRYKEVWVVCTTDAPTHRSSDVCCHPERDLMIRLCDRICAHYDLATGSSLLRQGQVTQEALPLGRHYFGDGGLAVADMLELRGVHIVDLELDPLLLLKEVVQCEGLDEVRIQVVQNHLGFTQ